MHITRNDIFNGCLVASISHAIMTNTYPQLAYEQSWDGVNYSIHDSQGRHGTITFEKDFCVGVIRNDNSNDIICGDSIQAYMRSFPPRVVQTAQEEALQYLLLENRGVVMPCISSVFWVNHMGLYYDSVCANRIQEDFQLLENIMLPKEIAIKRWATYYGMDTEVLALVDFLYHEKSKDFFSTIELSKKQQKLISEKIICDECIEAFRELNVVLSTD